MRCTTHNRTSRRRGNSLVEYLLILSFVSLAIVTVATLTGTGGALSSAYGNFVIQVISL